MKKYALLFAGGFNDRWNFPRYNNDLGFMNEVLIAKNYNSITILFSDGKNIVYKGKQINTLAANLNNFRTAIDNFKNNLDANDQLFIMVSNHGGSEPNGKASITCWGTEKLYLEEFVDLLNVINCSKIVVLGQCFGGNILSHSVTNSILISANEANEPSLEGRHNKDYEEFLYHFISYFNSQYPNGVQLTQAPTDDSIDSAFRYAYLNDSYRTTPFVYFHKGQEKHQFEIPQIKCSGCDPLKVVI